jgi:hypothetical protein
MHKGKVGVRNRPYRLVALPCVGMNQVREFDPIEDRNFVSILSTKDALVA